MPKLIIDLTSESAVSANPFLYADGMLNFGAIERLQAKVAAAIKADETTKVLLSFATKRRAKPLPYSAAKATKGDHKYLAARAIKVVSRKRVTPDSLARIAIILQIIDNAKLNASLKQAQSAIAKHQKKCETVLGKVTKEKGKLRDAKNDNFHASMNMLIPSLIEAGYKESDIVESQGMMGKSVLLRISPDHYVSIVAADKPRFAAAVKAAKAAATEK